MLRKKSNQAYAIPLVLSFLLVLSTLSLAFYSASGNRIKEASVRSERVRDEISFAAAIDTTKLQLQRDLSGIQTLSFSQSLAQIRDASDPVGVSRQYFNDFILPRLSSHSGVSAESLGTWNIAENRFDGVWFRSREIPDLELRYVFSALPARFSDNPTYFGFEFEWRIDARTSPDPNQAVASDFIYLKATDANVISIEYRPTPFSQWAIFRLENEVSYDRNVPLRFLGQRYTPGHQHYHAREVIEGPVFLGDADTKAIFFGDIIFRDRVNIVHPDGTGYQGLSGDHALGYNGSPQFERGVVNGVSPVVVPDQFYNLERVALGESSDLMAVDNSPLSNLRYRQLARQSALRVQLNINDQPLPAGIYIPVDNANTIKGGIYVESNVERMRLKKTTREQSEHAGRFAGDGFNTNCDLQMMEIRKVQPFEKMTVYSTDQSCPDGRRSLIVREVRSRDGGSVVDSGVFNGAPDQMIYVNGTIEALGQPERNDKALKAGQQLTIAARDTIKISNDITYEDATYELVDQYGNRMGVPADNPLDANVRADIPLDSQTVLGLISTQGRVLIKCAGGTPKCSDNFSGNAPSNINIHASIFAVDDNCVRPRIEGAYGCGFGFEAMDDAEIQFENKGVIKFLGSIVEFRNFGVGWGPKGYKRRYTFDRRFSTLAPPYFPVSDSPNATVSIQSMGALQFVKNNTHATDY